MLPAVCIDEEGRDPALSLYCSNSVLKVFESNQISSSSPRLCVAVHDGERTHLHASVRVPRLLDQDLGMPQCCRRFQRADCVLMLSTRHTPESGVAEHGGRRKSSYKAKQESLSLRTC